MKRFALAALAALLLAPFAEAFDEVPEFEWGGGVRYRYKLMDDDDFPLMTAPETTEDNQLLRTNVYLDAKDPTRHMGLRAHFQDTRTFGDGSTPNPGENRQNVDLREGFLYFDRLFDTNTTLVLGRQKLEFLDERLISDYDWGNYGQSFDGAAIQYYTPRIGGFQYRAGAFNAVIDEVGDAYDDVSLRGLSLGLSADNPLLRGLDIYNIAYQSGDPEANDSGGSLNIDRNTIGARWLVDFTNFLRFTAEYMNQGGKLQGTDIEADAYAFALGVRPLPRCRLRPRFDFGYDVASGDSDPGDDKLERFDPLFYDRHRYNGLADVVRFSNIRNWHAGASIDLFGGRLGATYHDFTLDESRDGWFKANGTLAHIDATGAAGDDIGNEIDVTYSRLVRGCVRLNLAYTRFDAGSHVDGLPLDDSFQKGWFEVGLPFGGDANAETDTLRHDGHGMGDGDGGDYDDGFVEPRKYFLGSRLRF